MDQNSETSKIVIPHSLEFIKLNDVYHVMIDHVYDPSKFWLIFHVKERQLFEKYLTNYYKDKKLLMSEYHIRMYTSCIICRNSIYYRAIILPALLHEGKKVRVFLFDYGKTVNVNVKDIYYIFKKHTTIPRFAIRGSLANIVPFNPREPWTQRDLEAFLALIIGKQLLAKITEIDYQEKVLHVVLYNVTSSNIESINEKMIIKCIGIFGTGIYNSNYKLSRYKRKIQYMHLIPTFHALENGMVPLSLWEQNVLKEVPLDLLFKCYYECQDINSGI